MGARLRLLTSASAIALVLSGAPNPASADDDPQSWWNITAEVASGGHSVSLGAHGKRVQSTLSHRSKVHAAAGPNSGGSISALPNVRDFIARACSGGAACGERSPTSLNAVFFGSAEDAATKANVAEAPPRTVTVDDLVDFLPATVGFHAEPDGWAVVGVPANFWTYVTPVTVEGQLLGEKADVRFTPRLYEWHYGDGSTNVTRTGGASWTGAGQDELTATPTGHVYSAKATVQASVTVIWSAEYRFAGGDWAGVEGAVSNSSPDERMLVVKERTVLTAG